MPCKNAMATSADPLAKTKSGLPGSFQDFSEATLNPDLTFKHYSGKVAPGKYGGTPTNELWLCFATFCTYQSCEHGAGCPYRHAKLEEEELVAILRLSPQNSPKFLRQYESCWTFSVKDSKRKVSTLQAPIVQDLPYPQSVPSVPQKKAAATSAHQKAAADAAACADADADADAAQRKVAAAAEQKKTAAATWGKAFEPTDLQSEAVERETKGVEKKAKRVHAAEDATAQTKRRRIAKN